MIVTLVFADTVWLNPMKFALYWPNGTFADEGTVITAELELVTAKVKPDEMGAASERFSVMLASCPPPTIVVGTLLRVVTRCLMCNGNEMLLANCRDAVTDTVWS